MKRKKLSKAESQRAHFKKRLTERYGYEINRQGQQQIVQRIQDGCAQLIKHQTNRVSVYHVCLEDGPMAYVVYDHQRKTLVTALPYENPIFDRNYEDEII